jgi:hypothetical protein
MSLSATALRSAVAVAALGVLGTAVPGSAAPAPQIVDAKGDATDGDGSHDVHSVLFGKTAKGFTVTMTLGGPQTDQQGVTYEISGETDSCGTFTIAWSPNTGLGGRDQVSMECGADGIGGDPYTIINVAPKAKGNTLTWTFNKKQFPTELRGGGTMSDLRAGVDPNDAVFGIFGPAALGVPVRLDDAVGKGSFRF